jgi:hypothetical protein
MIILSGACLVGMDLAHRSSMPPAGWYFRTVVGLGAKQALTNRILDDAWLCEASVCQGVKPASPP